jgi:hypothetical protein
MSERKLRPPKLERLANSGAKLEEAGAVIHGVLRKGYNPGIASGFGGRGIALFTRRGRAAGMRSVLFTVYPLEEDIEQKVKAQDTKSQE